MALNDIENEAKSLGFVMPESGDFIRDGDDAIRNNAVKALEVARVAWHRSDIEITPDTDLYILPPGAYRVTNDKTAAALGLPDPWPGIIWAYVIGWAGGLLTFTSLRGGMWQKAKVANAWGSWEPVFKDKEPGVIGPTDSLENLAYGDYVVTNDKNAAALGLPDAWPGTLHMAPVGSRGGLLTFTSLRGGVWQKAKAANAWGAWEPVAGQVDLLSSSSYREHLRQGLSARKGGRIGTGGLGAIALRFDDAPTEFREKALPILKELGLPFTRVTTSKSIHDTPIDPAEFPLMQTYCIENGGEVWNHGTDHKDATGLAAIRENIVGARDFLRAAMPRIPIDCFAIPGGQTAKFDGHARSLTPEHWDTVAGQIIMRNHALVDGYRENSYHRLLDGTPRDGQTYYGIDPYNLARVKSLVDRAKNWRVGICFMAHMNNIGSTGYMSLEDFRGAMEYIAAERDAGRLLVLTLSGLAFADKTLGYRDDLAVYASPLRPYSQTIEFPQYREGICGSTRELVAQVNGSPGAQVTSEIAGFTKTHVIPPSGSLTLRHIVTIPLDTTSLSIKISSPASGVSCLAV